MTVLDPPVTTQRLLSPGPFGPLPTLSLDQLVRLAEETGLTGRGGAGFPSAIKLRSVAEAGRAPAVVGNGMEGEPLSHKDAVLLTQAPGLVLDGLELVSRALRAKRTLLAVGPEIDPRPAQAAARSRGVDVQHLSGGFVAGQETALLNQLEGRPPVPRDPLTRVTTRGLDGRPTLVSNVETLAHLALAARFGAGWFRSVGLADDPGTSLFTITGAVDHEGVVEAARGTTIADLIAAARPHPGVQAVLVGGYHGAWVLASDFGTRLTRADLAPHGASVGAGIVHVLSGDACPLRAAADMASYLAGESAAQCGPCLNGLPRMADSLQRLAHGARDARLPAEIDRLRGLVVGRGACAHPDGTARLVGSTMRVFDAHVAAHLAGWCPTELSGGPR
ncbi:NADH-ubiquinone oxidoreductase-F iron-sulfur binding region domain-containing protein [Nocardioides sp.]|uniref:NADH-ubiquinone oxidoreductase-F iron-sulfur binding region domain-containing protein n=1 Tax=Nocardioides sp. TaxID=35761 RepID=UPI003528F1C4